LRRYEFGSLLSVDGAAFALLSFDPDDDGPADGVWQFLGRYDQFLPPIEPIPGLGYCLESAFTYPGELHYYETAYAETEDGIALTDPAGRPVVLDKLTGTWSTPLW
jgi:hypothetical protein